MTNGELIENLEKHELAFRLVNECWKCGFYQQNFSGDWFCTRSNDLELECEELFNNWKESEL